MQAEYEWENHLDEDNDLDEVALFADNDDITVVSWKHSPQR